MPSNILQTISKHCKKEGRVFLFQKDVVATLSLFKILSLFRTVNVLYLHGFLNVESSLFPSQFHSAGDLELSNVSDTHFSPIKCDPCLSKE